eukprot:EG_transcript_16211
MVGLGAVAFAILFKSSPTDISALKSEKIRNDLAKMAKKEEAKNPKKKPEKQAERKPKQDKDDKKKGKRSPVKQKSEKIVEEPKVQEVQEEEEEEEEEQNAIYVPSVPVQNFTPTTKPQRTRSPAKEEKAAKKEPLPMPSKRQIERDLSQGFVVVQKKGPPPLTPEQRKEREALRQKEEEEERRREAETIAREKEREKRRAEASTSNDVSLEDVKAKLEKHRQEKQSKQEERKKITCVVKEYGRVANESEDAEKKMWTAQAVVAEGEEEAPVYDTEEYPALQPTD